MAVERVFPEAERFPRTYYASCLRRDGVVVLVADVDGAVVGAVVGELTGTEGGIATLGVLPDAQGRGIGRALLTELVRRFAEVGVHRAVLGVRVDNAVAIALYRSLGFVAGRRLPGYYVGDGMDGLEMIREG